MRTLFGFMAFGAVAFAAGMFSSQHFSVTSGAAQATEGAEKPVYQIVSNTVVDPEQMAKYAAKSGPLARAAGLEILAISKPVLLEGEWPHKGENLIVLKYRSMDEMMAFWNSPEYQAAKKLRKHAAQVDFIVAADGYVPPAE